MVLEVVSSTSVRKDTQVLRELYWKAGVPEYWLADARRGRARFEILRHAESGYVAVDEQDGWITSNVFRRAFRLQHDADPLGNPQFTLQVADVEGGPRDPM